MYGVGAVGRRQVRGSKGRDSTTAATSTAAGTLNCTVVRDIVV